MMIKIQNRRAAKKEERFSVGEVILADGAEFYLLAQIGVSLVSAIFLTTANGNSDETDTGNRKCEPIKVQNAYEITQDELLHMDISTVEKVDAVLTIK